LTQNEYDTLTDAEQELLRMEWNKTASDYPKDKCIYELFEIQSAQTPDNIALIHPEGLSDSTVGSDRKLLTYRELNQCANQLAHYLQTLGVGPETLVGICMERSFDLIIGLLGILKAGGVYVPLDPTYPQERLAFMLEDTQAPILLTQRHLVKELPDHKAKVVRIDADWETIALKIQTNPNVKISVDSPAYVVYTSGSTGKPKGVVGLHKGAVNRMHWMWTTYPFEIGEVCCQKTSLNFIDSLWEIFGPLLQGVPSILIPTETSKDPNELIQILADNQVTRIVLVPSLLRLILDTQSDLSNRLAKLKYWVTSGEVLPVELLQRFQNRMPKSILLNLYGSSEITGDATWYDTSQGVLQSSVPIGKPLANMQTYILDKHLQLVPIGAQGELYIGGVGLAQRYLNRPELTAEKFIQNPFSTKPNEYLFKSGDITRYLPDGNIEFLGRVDHQVKIRGFRIELGEIETVLQQHPTVQEATAGDKRLVAYIVANQGQEIIIGQLRDFLKQKLPEHMIPAFYVILAALPLTPNGKVNRLALPTPTDLRPELEGAFVPARTPLEKRLADIWAKALGLEQVGIQDNFFELGGDSLLAAYLLTEIEIKLGVQQLPLAVLLQAPTIEQLAEVLHNEERGNTWSSLVPIQPKGSRPPFFFVHAHGGNVIGYYHLAHHLGPDYPFYGLQAQGLDGISSPFRRFEDMAAHYVKEIRTVQPRGPYYVGGWCLGGYVALEMARHLQAEGEEVALVVMVESAHPDYPKYLSRTGPFRRQLYQVIARLDLEASNFLEVESSRKLAYSSARISRLVNTIRVKFARMDYTLGETSPASNGVSPFQIQKVVEQAHAEASQVYRPKPYEGAVAVFRAAKQPLGIHPDPTLGWGEVIKSKLDLQEVPDNHIGLLSIPRVRITSDKIRKCFDKAHILHSKSVS